MKRRRWATHSHWSGGTQEGKGRGQRAGSGPGGEQAELDFGPVPPPRMPCADSGGTGGHWRTPGLRRSLAPSLGENHGGKRRKEPNGRVHKQTEDIQVEEAAQR
ncbi:hypothetical protein DPEC_G00300670 [Dallia pectoralis]|uniref:Uncharacterized protein n=1 Tax=Dallia pectoralis TaxID=75939 RepID=A0ACC2FGL6_DALPE|nr:hypothetical protein DPEC_G00300670 [Dallia pectoralis]